MTPSESKSLDKNPEKSSLVSRFFSGLLLVTVAFLIASAFMVTDYKKFSTRTKLGLAPSRSSDSDSCKTDCRPHGSEALPRGFVSETADLEMRPLWGPVKTRVRHHHL